MTKLMIGTIAVGGLLAAVGVVALGNQLADNYLTVPEATQTVCMSAAPNVAQQMMNAMLVPGGYEALQKENPGLGRPVVGEVATVYQLGNATRCSAAITIKGPVGTVIFQVPYVVTPLDNASGYNVQIVEREVRFTPIPNQDQQQQRAKEPTPEQIKEKARFEGLTERQREEENCRILRQSNIRC